MCSTSTKPRCCQNRSASGFLDATASRIAWPPLSATQAENASRITLKPRKEETGADFMLQGSINSVKDEISGKYVILYQVNLELVDLTTNEKAWIGQKEIKKVVSRRSFGF